MWQKIEDSTSDEMLFLAGRLVGPGRYRDLGTGRIVELEQEDRLPASLDGRVACYVRIAHTWAQTASAHVRRKDRD